MLIAIPMEIHKKYSIQALPTYHYSIHKKLPT